MPRMNWTEPPVSDFKPGIYLAEVKKCEEKRSKGGDPYLNLEWHDASAFGKGDLICWDIVMMDGKGRGLGQAKLKVLGFDEDDPMIEAVDLIGRRAWIRVDFQEHDGKKNLKVASTFRPTFESGYWHENTPPEGSISSVADLKTDEDVPF